MFYFSIYIEYTSNALDIITGIYPTPWHSLIKISLMVFHSFQINRASQKKLSLLHQLGESRWHLSRKRSLFQATSCVFLFLSYASSDVFRPVGRTVYRFGCSNWRPKETFQVFFFSCISIYKIRWNSDQWFHRVSNYIEMA